MKSKSAQLERQLLDRLKVLEGDIYSSEEAAQEFHHCKRELLEIHLLASREATVRAQARWLALGERPKKVSKKYFLNLESHHPHPQKE